MKLTDRTVDYKTQLGTDRWTSIAVSASNQRIVVGSCTE